MPFKTKNHIFVELGVLCSKISWPELWQREPLPETIFFYVGVKYSPQFATSVTSTSTFSYVASVPTGNTFGTVMDPYVHPKQGSENLARAPIPFLAHISERKAKKGVDCSSAKRAR